MVSGIYAIRPHCSGNDTLVTFSAINKVSIGEVSVARRAPVVPISQQLTD